MAEFINVMKEYNRMCHSYADCRDCPLCNVNCEYITHEKPEEVESIIMKWSKEHPQPIYPTIGEVVNKLLLLMGIESRTSNLTDVFDERLTKEAADYFGIKPINKNSFQSKV